MKKTSRREGFLIGALMLSLSGLLTKMSGLAFRVILNRMISGSADIVSAAAGNSAVITSMTDAAMSNFTSAFSVYTFLLALSSQGLPVGISAMVSKSLALGKYKDVKRLIRSVMIIFSLSGLVLSVLGVIFARPIGIIMNSEETEYCMRFIMPAIFFIAVVSVFRGFFQGYNNMKPTSMSNVIEAWIKLFAGCGISYLFKVMGYPSYMVVGGGILGVTLGTVGACLYMLIKYFFRKDEYRITVSQFMSDKGTPVKSLLKEFAIITVPIALSSVSISLMGMIDSAVIVQTLKRIVGEAQAKALYGAYGNKATSIFNLPSYFVLTIGVSLVPQISAAFAKKDKLRVKNTMDQAFKFSSVIAFAFAFGLAAVSTPTINLLYSGDNKTAGMLLSVLSLATISVGLANVTNNMLQAIGKSYLAIISVIAGTLVKSVCTWILVSVPALNVFGAPIATNIAYPVILIMNLIFIKKNFNYVPKFSEMLFKPLICGVACFCSAYGSLHLFGMFMSQNIALFPAVIVGAVVYIALIFVFKLLSIDEIKQIVRKK